MQGFRRGDGPSVGLSQLPGRVAATGGLSGLSAARPVGINPGGSRGSRGIEVAEGGGFHIALCETQVFCSNDHGVWNEGDKG